MSNSRKSKVEIFHRINRLKLKAGVDLDDERMGFIDPAAIKRAQAAIDSKQDDYTQELEEILVKLESEWDDLKKETTDKKKKVIVNKIYNYANNIKDLADTYGYKLMDHFSKSLRDFCEKLDPGSPIHQTIVQAHIDVMWIVYHDNIKDEGGPKANELKKVVAKAIEKYSKEK